MSRGSAALIGLFGAVAGAYAGAPYLGKREVCEAAGSQIVQCNLNEVWLPFVSAVVLGMVGALVIANSVGRLVTFGGQVISGERPRREEAKPAVEIDDPYLQLAAWGAAPRKRERKRTLNRHTEQRGEWREAMRQRSRAVSPAGESEPGDGRLGRRGRPVPKPRNED